MSSLRSFAAVVVTLVICRVLVGLPLGSCCSSGLRGSVLCLVCMLVTCLWYGLCSSSVHDRGVDFPTLIGFAFGFRAVPLPPADAVGFGLGWSAWLSDLLQGRCCSFTWVPLLCPGCGGSFHPVHSPLSSFGMWSPFRVISVLCHY